MQFRQKEKVHPWIRLLFVTLRTCQSKLATGIVVFLLGGLWVSNLLASSDESNPSLLIAQNAARLMPRSFRGLMPKYSASLEMGMKQFSCQPCLEGQGQAGLGPNLLKVAAETVQLLRDKPHFPRVMKEMGSLAEVVLLLNLPNLDVPAPTDTLRGLKIGLEINSPSFRVVVYDSGVLGSGMNSLKELLLEMRNRRVVLSRHYRDFFSNRQPLDLTVPLDPKSAAFGILAQIYSHSINDLARVWLWIWSAANGDLADSPLIIDSRGKLP